MKLGSFRGMPPGRGGITLKISPAMAALEEDPLLVRHLITEFRFDLHPHTPSLCFQVLGSRYRGYVRY
jgi:hypothetical protein